jgi:hypothetical protein
MDRERQQPYQTALFSQREVAQFGVRANPVMPFSPGKLKLLREDPRTEEEIEHDRIREAQRQTVPLFDSQIPATPACPPPDPDIAILWINRQDLLQRRPDLAPQIEKLGDHEVEALGALVGEALQEFFWIQLNVILSLYLDHELQLRRRVR